MLGGWCSQASSWQVGNLTKYSHFLQSLTTIIVALGVSYAVSQIPNSLPRRLSTKLSAQLSQIDYTHKNAQRVSSEVRRALKYPADKLREGLQRSVEQLQDQKHFGNLVRESNDIRSRVDRVDLEGPAPGIAASYDM